MFSRPSARAPHLESAGPRGAGAPCSPGHTQSGHVRPVRRCVRGAFVPGHHRIIPAATSDTHETVVLRGSRELHMYSTVHICTAGETGAEYRRGYIGGAYTLLATVTQHRIGESRVRMKYGEDKCQKICRSCRRCHIKHCRRQHAGVIATMKK
ncbi:hypothetical protein FA95DRAFT_1379595 [Auriscalpium vulgare]|uniref:Uncharacterized protein n=1 Tax=Auriscalpium vulgare TaxID=40419 RepID=A0ACB8S928_9AGAM|nr:hypothetical protein FA95DRAFT_1379595 [Auriscalpium vulgare]